MRKEQVCCTTCIYFSNYHMDGPCKTCGLKRNNWIKNPDSALYKQSIITTDGYVCASHKGIKTTGM